MAGLLLVSTSGPFVKCAQMNAFSIVLIRTLGSAPIFLGWAAITGKLSLKELKPHLGPILLGGFLLAVHWLLWIKAFDLTDYASNLLLLVVEPATAAVLGFWTDERPTLMTWLALLASGVGLAVVAGGDISLGPTALLGDGLCVIAAAAIALFFVVTRRARSTLPLAAFMGWTLSVAALFVAPVVLLSGATFGGHPATSWGWALALVVLTTVLGHGCMNLAARHVRLFAVNLVVVLEPALGVGMGAVLFGATVRPTQWIGGAILSAACLFGLLPQQDKPNPA
jgi:drug/metabolite transporter (DMT)-like permease